MNDNNSLLTSPNVIKSAVVALALLSAFLLMKTISELRVVLENQYTYNSITVNGVGEVFAVPDIASFTYSVTSEAPSAIEAQKKATEIHNKAIQVVKDAGVEEKDIVAVPNVYPKYSYNYRPCTALSCPSNQTISGYEATYGVTVKVRNPDAISDLLTKVAEAGATNISGVTYTIDDEEVLKAEARTKAIADAKAKAEKLAEDLGVDLDEVMSFYENNGAVGYGGGAMDSAVAPMVKMTSVVAELPKGENQIRVDVSVTYKID